MSAEAGSARSVSGDAIGRRATSDAEWFGDRVAAVTGGGSGIGQAIALGLAAAGASVVIGDIAAASAEDTAHRIGRTAATAIVDVSRAEDAERLVRTAIDRFGRLDFLVNCAGNASVAPVLELSESDWRSLIAVHLTGTFLCCRAAAGEIAERGGSVVSMASLYAFKGRPNAAHYSAAKAGIVGLTKVLATELAPRATANAIAPGPIDTPRWRAGLNEEELAAKRARRVADVPLGRLGAPQDIADIALFLLGPRARWITGQVMHVNGGEYFP